MTKKKQEHVPETQSRRPNRAERRGSLPAADAPVARDETPPEDQQVGSVRAKSSGHRKKTADNWNQ
jgi:hypothetical protein